MGAQAEPQTESRSVNAEPLMATRGAFLISVKKSYPMGENALQMSRALTCSQNAPERKTPSPEQHETRREKERGGENVSAQRKTFNSTFN